MLDSRLPGSKHRRPAVHVSRHVIRPLIVGSVGGRVFLRIPVEGKVVRYKCGSFLSGHLRRIRRRSGVSCFLKYPSAKPLRWVMRRTFPLCFLFLCCREFSCGHAIHSSRVRDGNYACCVSGKPLQREMKDFDHVVSILAVCNLTLIAAPGGVFHGL